MELSRASSVAHLRVHLRHPSPPMSSRRIIQAFARAFRPASPASVLPASRPFGEPGAAAGPGSDPRGAVEAADRLGFHFDRVSVQRAPDSPGRINRTGLPDHLKTGIERLSGTPLDDVRVRYNSPAPARIDAAAYTQGTEIHVAPGQERHLGHEAWHVVQQKRGRVRPTLRIEGAEVNDDPSLEREADVMGARAGEVGRGTAHAGPAASEASPAAPAAGGAIQRMPKGTPFSEKVKNRILKANRQQNGGFYTCSHCNFQHQQRTYFGLKGGRTVGDGRFHVDHVKAKSKGGKGVLANGRVLCGTCNSSRGNRKKIGMTGYSKYRGLDMGTKTFRMAPAKYRAAKKLWRQKNGWKPIA